MELAVPDRRSGELVERPCFWCDGSGEHVLDAGPAGECHCRGCHRPAVAVAGQWLCPDCTRYILADAETESEG